jgi:hypothetical protein
MGTVWDDPNQQVVRADESASWEEGTGGEPGMIGDPKTGEPSELDEMTKAQLLEYAQGKGYSPANNGMSKEELRAVIDDNEGETG